MIHDAPEAKIQIVALGVAGLRNSGFGIYGGHPGAPSILVQVENSDVRKAVADKTLPDELEEAGGAHNLLGYRDLHLSADDLLYLRCANGGGYGDPLERDSENVVQDVIDGLVSREAAESIYGVVLADGQGVDADATRGKTRCSQARAAGRRLPRPGRVRGSCGGNRYRPPSPPGVPGSMRCRRSVMGPVHPLRPRPVRERQGLARRLRRGRRPAHPGRPAHGPARRPVRVPALVLPGLQRPAQFGDRGGGGAAGVRRRSGVLRRRSGAASFRQAPGEGVVGEGFKLGCVASVLQFSAGHCLNINDKTVLPKSRIVRPGKQSTPRQHRAPTAMPVILPGSVSGFMSPAARCMRSSREARVYRYSSTRLDDGAIRQRLWELAVSRTERV